MLFTVSGLLDGNHEIITIDDQDIALVDAASGTTTKNSIDYVISITDNTATVSLTQEGLTDAQMTHLVNELAYKNNLATPTVGDRVVTLTSVRDTGNLDLENRGDNERVLKITSVVHVSNVLKTFAKVLRTTDSANFTWTAPVDATELRIQQSTDSGLNWGNSTHSALAKNSSSGTVTGLAGNHSYKFRLLVKSGANSGASNAVDVAALNNSTLVTSTNYTVSSGQTANETISSVLLGTTKEHFLAALAKGDPDQTWDDTQISATLSPGDKLVVTAADGITTTTYTVPKLTFNGMINSSSSHHSVSLSWPAVTGATALKVQVSSDGGTTWTDATNNALVANSTSTTVTDLNAGTLYKFRLVITGGDCAGNSSVVSVRTRSYSSSVSAPSTPTNKVIEVNGKKQDAGAINTKTTGGKTITTIQVDDTKLNKIIEKAGEKPTVTLPTTTGSSIVVGEINGQTVKNMQKKDATLQIKTGTASYTLPAAQINIDDVSDQIGSKVKLKDIKVSVTIAEPPADTVKVVEDTAKKNNYQIVVPPIEFEITCASGNKTVQVSKFNCYVERTVAIPERMDPSKITTGVVLNTDGTFRHVPTEVVKINGKYYAKINSLTNSIYSVIWNPVTFTDVANHWAKDAVNDMGSRMIVTGVGSDTYEPDRSITRAEFAAIVVRALGLTQGTTENSFGDVSASDWFNGYVDTATEFRLITGYTSTEYGPNDTITREQAMAIISRAMKITGLNIITSDTDVDTLISKYADGSSISDYAKNGIAACIKSDVVTGKSASTLAPKAAVTHAEVAVMIKNLLERSDLI